MARQPRWHAEKNKELKLDRKFEPECTDYFLEAYKAPKSVNSGCMKFRSVVLSMILDMYIHIYSYKSRNNVLSIMKILTWFLPSIRSKYLLQRFGTRTPTI